MKIRLTSIFVEDQDRALRFYTDVVGFVKKQDVPAGGARWITVVSPEASDELQLVLEPNRHPAARAYQEALLKDGIPVTAFESADIRGETRRLKEHGVVFTMEPTMMGPVTMAVFADTCGNLIQIYQRNAT
jgi:catechol 2,3-dioxygenase-like lactoylglutathione lyase family enzyme